VRLRSPNATRLGGGPVGSPPVGTGGARERVGIFFLPVGNMTRQDKTRSNCGIIELSVQGGISLLPIL
jgi:hypothetical protein